MIKARSESHCGIRCRIRGLKLKDHHERQVDDIAFVARVQFASWPQRKIHNPKSADIVIED
jgi:hypothetical protein